MDDITGRGLLLLFVKTVPVAGLLAFLWWDVWRMRRTGAGDGSAGSGD